MAATASEKASSCEAVSEPDGSDSASASASADDESADGAASSSDVAPSSSAASASSPEDCPETPAASSSAASAAGDNDDDGHGSIPESDEDGHGSIPEPDATESDGSGRSSAASSGDGATQSEDDSGSKPGSAATATVAPSKVVETFDADASQTLEEHAASHNFPMHVKTCGPCRFWKHRVKWSVYCSATNPVTLKKETWLGHAGCGFGVCLFCAAHGGGRCRSSFGRGKGSLRRLQNITRHAKYKEHQEAEAACTLASDVLQATESLKVACRTSLATLI